ncbi:hypothetical protein RB2083_2221 [Rhodobacteraceae bacterium HTCC2083]|nr:hypothetical protein RB2083_2221 [Rhodobacteraceae bacterium HTCC2083]
MWSFAQSAAHLKPRIHSAGDKPGIRGGCANDCFASFAIAV